MRSAILVNVQTRVYKGSKYYQFSYNSYPAIFEGKMARLSSLSPPVAPACQQRMSYPDLKKMLEMSAKELVKGDFELDELDFFRKAEYNIVKKARNAVNKKVMISEKRNSFRNVNGEEIIEFEMKTMYVETTSLNVCVSTGSSVLIGGGPTIGYMGSGCGINLRYQRSKRKTEDESQSDARTLELCLKGRVKPKHFVVVKQIEYQLSTQASGKFDIILDPKKKVTYTSEAGNSTSVKLKDLLGRELGKEPAIEHTKEIVIIHLQGEWERITTSSTLEFYTKPLRDQHFNRLTSKNVEQPFTVEDVDEDEYVDDVGEDTVSCGEDVPDYFPDSEESDRSEEV